MIWLADRGAMGRASVRPRSAAARAAIGAATAGGLDSYRSALTGMEEVAVYDFRRRNRSRKCGTMCAPRTMTLRLICRGRFGPRCWRAGRARGDVWCGGTARVSCQFVVLRVPAIAVEPMCLSRIFPWLRPLLRER